MESFRYDCLDPSLKQIRILTIAPSFRWSGPIKCALRTSSFGELGASVGPLRAPFIALSYTWEHSDDKRTMWVNGAEFLISPNLESALRQFRGRLLPRLFWIDALCIDQNNLQERAQQVSLMSEIYSKAWMVYAWLGPGDEDDALVLRLLEQIGKQHAKSQGDLQNFLKWGLSTISFGDNFWLPLARILEHPWWTRVWVIQEASVATNLFVFCGDSSVSWNVLRHAAYGLRVLFQAMALAGVQNSAVSQSIDDNAMVSIAEGMLNFSRIDESIVDQRTDRKWEFCDYLKKFRYSSSTDPRDKVYALLGLLPEEQRSRLSVLEADYSITCPDLYIKVARYYLEQHAQLEIIQECFLPALLSGLPSWVPDWTRRKSETISSIPDLQHEPHNLFCAGGTREKSFAVSNLNNTLMVGGIQIGIVKDAGDVLELYAAQDAESKSSRVIGRWLGMVTGLEVSNWWEAVSLNPSRFNGQVDGPDASTFAKVRECFCSTIVASTSHSPPEDFNNWEEWMSSLYTHQVWPELTGSFQREFSLSTQPLEWASRIGQCCSGRRFCMLENGHMGLMPEMTGVGDIICIFFGLDVPSVLRKVGDQFVLVGSCYVQGFMKGEAIRELDEGRLESSTFVLQ